MGNKQSKILKDVIELITNNPKLPVITSVDSEVACDGYHSFFIGSITGEEIKDVISCYEDTYFRQDMDDEELFEELFWDGDDSLNTEKRKIMLDSLPWKKCIVIKVSIPDVLIADVSEER